MNPPNLDHVGLIVRDLEQCRSTMAALGFTLTSRAEHTMTNAQGQVVPAGSAQHSIMLGEGYVELMQIFDPSAGHQLAPAVAVRHGMHILAFGTDDATQTHADFQALGQPVGPLRRWARPVHDGVHSGLARFAFFDAPWTAHDPSYLCWVQHLTPELIRLPGSTVHANKALALTTIHYAGPPASATAWAARLAAAGYSPVRHGTALELNLGNAALRIAQADGAPSMVPVRLDLRVSSLADLPLFCRRAGLQSTAMADGVLVVETKALLGLDLGFVAA